MNPTPMVNQTADAPASTDRYDPKLEQQIRGKFVALTERLALEGAHHSSADIWAYASTHDPEGKVLWKQWQDLITLKKRMELAGRQQFQKHPEAHPETYGGFVNSAGMIPTKNPRSVALVGLTMSASDAEFERAWRTHFPPGRPAPTTPPSRASVTDDAAKTKRAEQAFLDVVAKLQDKGNTWQQAWQIAGMTEPGKSLYEEFARACATEKHIS